MSWRSTSAWPRCMLKALLNTSTLRAPSMKPSHLPPLGLALLATTSVFGQGTVDFSTFQSKPRPLITLWDGTPITGDNYLIDILVRNPATSEFTQSGLQRLTTPGPVPLHPVSPYPGRPGTFAGGTIQIDFLAPCNTATVRILAWDSNSGASYATASIRGSATFDVDVLGSCGGGVPSSPARLARFEGIVLVPEPSEWLLGIGGLVTMIGMGYFQRNRH